MDRDITDTGFATTVELVGDHLIVVVSGEVDMATAGRLYDAATSHPAARLTLDLRQVSFIDSAAIHSIIRLADRYPTAMTVHPSARVRRVLEISGLSEQPWMLDERGGG